MRCYRRVLEYFPKILDFIPPRTGLLRPRSDPGIWTLKAGLTTTQYPTYTAYTPVSLRCTLHKLAQPCPSCGWTKLGSMSNFPGLSPYVSGHHLFVFFSICRICLMHFH